MDRACSLILEILFFWWVKVRPTSETPGCLDHKFSVMGPRTNLRDKICLKKNFFFNFSFCCNVRLAKIMQSIPKYP